MAETAVSAVLMNVGNLAVQETSFLGGVTLEVAFLKDELMWLQGYLKDAERKRRSGNATIAILMSQIRDAAYEAENVIEAADYMKKRNNIKKGFMGAISSFRGLPIKESQHTSMVRCATVLAINQGHTDNARHNSSQLQGSTKSLFKILCALSCGFS